MSIIIRLQNLPWSANSVDIRRYFAGLSIPDGGVHIVGGEMGDAFIAFSTDEDARLAMAKDGGKIKDMQIKLLLSSRTEMMRVIEQARQQNVIVPQILPQVVATPATMIAMPPPTLMTPTLASSFISSLDEDRRRGHSPSPHHRSRDKSPSRDRRRSPDRRSSSKRDRSRSPPRSSRGSSRETDRRGERFRREERRHDDIPRYRDDRRVPRDMPQDNRKYTDSTNFNNRSQNHSAEGMHENVHVPYEKMSNVSGNNSFPYSTQQSLTGSKTYPTTLYTFPRTDTVTSVHQAEVKPNFVPLVDPRTPLPPTSSGKYGHEAFRSIAYEQAPINKDHATPPNAEEQFDKPRRRTRFDSEYLTSSEDPQFMDSSKKLSPPEIPTESSIADGKISSQPQEFLVRNETWPHEMNGRSESGVWKEKRHGLLNPPASKANDFAQTKPMDVEQTPNENNAKSDSYQHHLPQRSPSTYAGTRNERPVRGPPMANDQGRGQPSLTIEVRRIRPDTKAEDILEIFHGITLPPGSIRLQFNSQGRTEKAFVRFSNAADFEEALSMNRHLMQEGRCEIVECPAVAFESVPRAPKSKPKPKPREDDLCVQLRGLPFSCKEEDVVGFFDGLGILDLFVDVASDGRASGVGFVEFGTVEDFRSALAMNGKMIGHRYITVSVASKEMMAFARGEDYSPTEQKRAPPLSHTINEGRFPVNQGRPPPSANQNRPAPSVGQGRPPVTANQGRPPVAANQGRPPVAANQGRPPAASNQGRPPVVANQGRIPPPNQGRPPPPPCISMRGLPECVTNTDIADFLNQVGVAPRAIHIMLRPDKMPSGDAFAELASVRDADASLEMDGGLMLENRVSVTPITYREMSEVLRRPAPLPPPPPVPGPLLRTPNEMEPRPRRPLLPQGPPDEGPYRERPRAEPPVRGGRPLLEPYSNRMEPPGRPPFGRMRAPWPNRGMGPEGRFPPPPQDRGIKDFGAPGCVVSINNLHFRAGLEELLDFFQGYNLSKDSIIRKYNENGQTTGEARVAFQNPREAQRAVRELNQKPIMGRPLTLTLL